MLEVQVEHKPNPPKPHYPCMMKSKRSPLVVLFSRGNCGTVVVADEGGSPIGAHFVTWDMATFEHFDGAITLRNKAL